VYNVNVIEQGKVIKISDKNLAEVQMKASPRCVNCGLCKKTGEFASIEALNKIGAKLGDAVKIEIMERKILLAYFLVYILPILALVFGYFIGGIFWAFAFSLFYFLLLYYVNKTAVPKSISARIVEVMQKIR
jgi:positive regulator of sigma E activity